ncbi:hypothetical protein BpHYR1_007122 [Brachionus plicatilis]|uniref:Uncharacterized protein n=1 Tax=Brachionus plicatilis TaxID=10195 RepID=A0A3M7QY56_BRAPC|nr:hypothetical protein BpHYR1_007122 [Brachionus plicatilis]
MESFSNALCQKNHKQAPSDKTASAIPDSHANHLGRHKRTGKIIEKEIVNTCDGIIFHLVQDDI